MGDASRQAIIQEKTKYYYDNEATKLHKLVRGLLRKIGGHKDLEDFYCLANEVFARAIKTFDETQDFDHFLTACLNNRIKSHMEYLHRKRRSGYNKETHEHDISVMSLDSCVEDDGTCPILDAVAIRGASIEDNVIGQLEIDERVEEFLKSLTPMQQEILYLVMRAYEKDEIMKKLNITPKDYKRHMDDVRASRDIVLLYQLGGHTR